MKIMQQLSAKDLPEDYEMILVDKLPYHCIKTEYYALAAGTESDHTFVFLFQNTFVGSLAMSITLMFITKKLPL